MRLVLVKALELATERDEHMLAQLETVVQNAVAKAFGARGGK